MIITMMRFNLNHLILILTCVCLASCAETIPFSIAWKLQESQPIECHVRFIDQNGRSVSNAKVQADILEKKSDATPYPPRSITGLFTDNKGELHITGEKGGELFLKVTDPAILNGSPTPGHPGGIFFKYSKLSDEGNRNYGTKEVPTTVLVWRKEGDQSLVSINGEIMVNYDGSPIHVDLEKGTLVDEGGDLIIDVSMPKTDAERRKIASRLGLIPHDCKVTITNGGYKKIGPYGDEYENIYGIFDTHYETSVISGQSNVGGAQYKNIRSKGTIIGRNGHLHGKIQIQVRVEDVSRGEGRVVIKLEETLLNFTGSRSLEIDPTRLTKLTLTDARKKPDIEQNKPEPVKP